MEHEEDISTNCNWCARNDNQKLGKGAGRVGNVRTSQDHPQYHIRRNEYLVYDAKLHSEVRLHF